MNNFLGKYNLPKLMSLEICLNKPISTEEIEKVIKAKIHQENFRGEFKLSMTIKSHATHTHTHKELKN